MAQQFTLTYDERVQGWTSFHSYKPEWMLGMNNRFFTFRGGNLFLHHITEGERNTYYGQKYPTKISLMFNDSPSDIKFLKAISTEGNTTWDVVLTAYKSSIEDFSRSTITRQEFKNKEGIQYAHSRRNEIQDDMSSKSSYGMGIVNSFLGSTGILMANDLPFSLSIGDNVLNVQEQVVGKVAFIVSDRLFNLETPPVNLSPGDFILGSKNSRVEGSEMRGYTIRLDLENDDSTKVELFAVNAEVAKSFT